MRCDVAVIEELMSTLLDRGLFRRRLRPAQHGADDACMRAKVSPDHDVFERGHIREQTDILKSPCDAVMSDRMRFQTADPAPSRGGKRFCVMASSVTRCKRRLAGPIGPDQPENTPAHADVTSDSAMAPSVFGRHPLA